MAFVASAAGSADAVDVHFGIAGDVVVDNQIERVDVESAGGDVGGDHDGYAVVGKADQGLVTFFLFEIAMQRQYAEAVIFQLLGQFFNVAFGVAENHG